MESWIVYLLENILEKCYLVTVTTSDFDTAYRIFSTINTRGLDLQLNDILKAEIIGKIEGYENKEKYTQIFDFEQKKNKYFKSDSVTTFPLTVNVINNLNWTEDIVCNNQKIYVDKLINIWNLSFTNI